MKGMPRKHARVPLKKAHTSGLQDRRDGLAFTQAVAKREPEGPLQRDSWG